MLTNLELERSSESKGLEKFIKILVRVTGYVGTSMHE